MVKDRLEENKRQEEEFGWLYRLDSAYRRRDWKISRTRGGLLERFEAFRGYSPLAIVPFILLLWVLVLGPTTSTSAWWALTSLISVVATYLLLAKFTSQRLPVYWAQILTIALVTAFAIVCRYLVTGSNVAAPGGRYVHLLHILVVFLVLVTVLARIFAGRILQGSTKHFPTGKSPTDMLGQTELFERPKA